MFASAVYVAARAVLDQHGTVGYKEKWVEHPFPEREVAILGEAIAAMKRSR